MNATTNTDLEIPAALRRVQNAKGVTLSAGVDNTAARAPAKPAKEKRSASTERTQKPVKAPKAAKPAKEPKAPKAAKTAAPATTDGEEPKVVRSIVPKRYKERYAKTGGTNGDDVAKELKAATTFLNEDKRETLDEAALWGIAKENGIDVSKYVKLNNGQKRMNVGNKLRGLLKAGTDIKIGKRRIKAEDFVTE